MDDLSLGRYSIAYFENQPHVAHRVAPAAISQRLYSVELGRYDDGMDGSPSRWAVDLYSLTILPEEAAA